MLRYIVVFIRLSNIYDIFLIILLFVNNYIILIKLNYYCYIIYFYFFLFL